MEKTDKEIVESANDLARRFYSMLGYQAPEGYRFDRATHPQEIGMWNMAVEAFEHIEGTDVINSLAGLDVTE